MPGSPKAREAPRRWCRASTTCGCTCTSARRAAAASRSSRPSGPSTRRSPSSLHRPSRPDQRQRKENEMLLATTQVEDVARFMEVFSTSGAEKRKEHGSKGAVVFRDPSESDRIWAIFDWDAQGWQSFVSDPDVPPILA